MSDPIRILHLEDDPNDAELVALQLKSDGLSFEIERVRSQKEFSAALDQHAYDLILTDSTGPSFSGRSALILVKEKCPAIPFIVVSGGGDPDAATEALENGAAGYVLKHRLQDLGPCITKAIHPTR